MTGSPPTQVLRIKTRRHWDAGLIGHNMGDSRPDHAATTGERPPVVVLADERQVAKRVLRDLLDKRKGAPGKPPHEVVEILVAGLPRYADMLAAGESHGDIDLRVRRWADDSLTFLRTLGGGNMQLVGAALHQDESSPHIHAMFVPRTKDNKLSWRTCCGAGAHKFVEIQDAYYEQVGKKHGLARGDRLKSTRKHMPIDAQAAIETKAREIAADYSQDLRARESALDERARELDERTAEIEEGEKALEKKRKAWEVVLDKAKKSLIKRMRSIAKQLLVMYRRRRARSEKLPRFAPKSPEPSSAEGMTSMPQSPQASSSPGARTPSKPARPPSPASSSERQETRSRKARTPREQTNRARGEATERDAAPQTGSLATGPETTPTEHVEPPTDLPTKPMAEGRQRKRKPRDRSQPSLRGLKGEERERVKRERQERRKQLAADSPDR